MQADQGGVNANDGLKTSSVDPAANTTDRVTQFWQKYSKEADDYDRDFLLKNGNNIEGVLIFAGLFSAVSASFLVSMQADLQPNPTDTTNALLMMLVNADNNSALSNQALGIPVWNGPSSAVVCSQVLGYAALSASLLAALGAVLGKQWLSGFTRLRSGPLQERGRIRQQKLDGLKRWRFQVFMGALPALIQLALLLFSIALSIKLWELNHGVGTMVIVATALGVLFYLFITLASLLSPTCPFHTPVSSTIHTVMRVAMKSVEDIAEYWAWRSDKDNQKRPMISPPNRILALVAAVIFSSVLTVVSTILLAMLAAFGPIFMFVDWILGGRVHLQTKIHSYHSTLQLKTLRPRFHYSMCLVRDSARRARDFMRRAYLDPDPLDSDPRSIAWILETSTDPDNLMAAAELVPDVKWPDDLDISLSTEHLYSIFIRSIPEKGSTNERALRLGKAFVIMLCQMSKDVSTHVWQSALKRVTEESRNPDLDSDLLFILTVVTKLLSHKLGSEDRGVEFPSDREVSQPLLAWLLQPLEILLRLEHPRQSQSRFLPEANRVFLKLMLLEESKLERMQELQYCRTFELYFNSVVGWNLEQTDE
ncbi:hypothetical protein OG21DRAFT_613841 [Imleria badia]|nr:hypothetical protein OG21DRAFT_613841 [Imleria badia]